MMIDEHQKRKQGEDEDREKEIKVKIPLDYHIKLHTVKVVQGQNISDTVRIALDEYFDDLREEQEAEQAAD